jgi:hypothetical protein
VRAEALVVMVAVTADFLDLNFEFLNPVHSTVGFEVLTPVVLRVAIFWDVAPCSQYVSRCFGVILPSHHLARWFLSRLIIEPEDGDYTFLQNVG